MGVNWSESVKGKQDANGAVGCGMVVSGGKGGGQCGHAAMGGWVE